MSVATLEIDAPELGSSFLLTVLKCPLCSEGIIAEKELQRIFRKGRKPAMAGKPAPPLRLRESGAGR
ncbi:hypothetical protein OR16_38714 [Cupriavidus basilensis OR16]|uniref:Uncharacterized protein n=1 Tax=Cupriavidus basilensis OR16 TaxID=1127483 RepID=H1SH42_9BURK|nr:hypothetical protein [Cupriavidus basilensis]EHP38155.1 hypothetical protein OR16_38714 [Cupriavidus basilensis OR16]